MPGTHDLIGGAVIGLAFLVLIGIAELWRRVANPKPESTRKLVHLGGGLVCLLFPFVIESHWVVLALAVSMGILFLAGRALGLLKSVHGIERKSHGTEYYPLVIYLLFLLAADEPWKFVICVLVLAVADAMAALVGSRYGRIRYEVEDEWKSLEGSAVFLVVTFLVVFLCLALWRDSTIPPPATCALAALLVAALATCFEAVSLRGGDNLWVPLGTYFVLSRILERPTAEIALEIASLAVMCAAIGTTAWRSQAFNVGGTLTFILYAFASWSLGSFHWALPVLLGLVVYVIVLSRAPVHETHKVRPVLRSLLPPFLVLVGANVASRQGESEYFQFLYGPYLAGCVTVVAQGTWNQLFRNAQHTGTDRRPSALLVSLLSVGVIALPMALVQRHQTAAPMLNVAGVCVAVALLYGCLGARLLADPNSWLTIGVRFALTTLAMTAVAILQQIGLSPLWPTE